MSWNWREGVAAVLIGCGVALAVVGAGGCATDDVTWCDGEACDPDLDLDEVEDVEVAERDQAPQAGENTAPEELPVFDWKEPSAELCTGGGGVCDSDQNSSEPGCQHRVPPATCCGGLSCNASPVSSCASRCNYGYVCTANCSTANPTWKSSHHSSCLDYVFTGKVYNPGPDLVCGNGDDTVCVKPGQTCNAGKDGRCSGADGSNPEYDDDNLCLR